MHPWVRQVDPMQRLMALFFCLGTFFPRQTCAQSEPQLSLDKEGLPAPSDALIRVRDGDSCLDAGRLSVLVQEHLGDSSMPPSLGVVVFNDEGMGFFLQRDGETIAERRFDSVPESCESRHAAFAVVIALAVEHAVETGVFDKPEPPPEEMTSGDKSEASAAGATESEPSPAPAEPSTPAEKPREKPKKKKYQRKRVPVKEGPGLRFSLGGAFISRILPEPALYGTFGLAAYLGHRFTVGSEFLISEVATTHWDEPEGFGAHILANGNSQMRAGRALMCWEPLIDDGSIGLCSGLAAGSARITGAQGIRPDREATHLPWLAGFARAGLRYPARGPGGIHLAGDFFANAIRPGLELTGGGDEVRKKDTGIVAGAVFVEMFLVLE